jgi:hypothetical protein
MNAKPLYVANDQSMALEEMVQSREREITEVFVIDRIELASIDQLLDVGHFKRADPILFQEQFEAADGAVEVSYVS